MSIWSYRIMKCKSTQFRESRNTCMEEMSQLLPKKVREGSESGSEEWERISQQSWLSHGKKTAGISLELYMQSTAAMKQGLVRACGRSPGRRLSGCLRQRAQKGARLQEIMLEGKSLLLQMDNNSKLSTLLQQSSQQSRVVTWCIVKWKAVAFLG